MMKIHVRFIFGFLLSQLFDMYIDANRSVK